ncbi:MAG: response regulator transcription factor [Erysipelotrichaceae bacterium]
MRILLIEDEIELAKSTATSLEKNNFIVKLAHNAQDAIELLSYEDFSLVILDLNLPDMDGLEILRMTRSKNRIPVIIASARESELSVVEGLDLGADDYIIKPYKIEILVARIYAVLRRFQGQASQLLSIEQLSLNRSKQLIQYKEQTIEFTNKEYAILEYLMVNYPNLVSSENIISYVYDPDFNPFSSVIRVHFANLRKKLLHATQNHFSIDVVKGKGYKLCHHSNPYKEN